MSKVSELTIWKEQLVQEMENCRQEIARIQSRLKEAEKRLSLVDRLLALEGGGEPIELKQPQDNLVKACEDLLRERGKPMHVSELHRLLLANGVPIPGKGLEANLIVRLQRSDGRFIRTGKGIYGLPEFGLPEAKPKRRVGARRGHHGA